jgi:hypothetical protein
MSADRSVLRNCTGSFSAAARINGLPPLATDISQSVSWSGKKDATMSEISYLAIL